ncbi:hypothetical protein JCM10212_006727 [Sporobolomyces blumeae]
MSPSLLNLLSVVALCASSTLATSPESLPAREVWKQEWHELQKAGRTAHKYHKDLWRRGMTISVAGTGEASATADETATSVDGIASSSTTQPVSTDASSSSSSTTRPTVTASSTSVPSSTLNSPLSSTTTTAAPSPYSSTSTRALAATTCASAYTGGAFTITGTGTLPSPTAFVKKAIRSQQLTLNNAPYRIVGPNIYWLCQDENYGPVGSYTDKARIREALAAAVAMGANTIRAHSCGISVGPNNPYNLEPRWRVFNDSAWDARDYAIYAAGRYGLRMILPLTDNYKYYHGSKYDFLSFRFADTSYPGTAFYSNRAVINAYGEYIQTVLARVNPYTGLRYADDPTILAWETGNELGGYINREPWPTTYFTTSVIRFIRAVDTNHLVLDGTNGFYNYTTKATSLGLTNRGVNMVTDHGYPRSVPLFNAQVPLAANNAKNFLIGEWDWTNSFGGSSIDDYITALEGNAYVGDMIWSLFGHDPQCCAYVTHNDGYSLYYPNGPNTADQQANILKVVQHWYRVTNRPIPSTLPGVACPQPEF